MEVYIDVHQKEILVLWCRSGLLKAFSAAAYNFELPLEQCPIMSRIPALLLALNIASSIIIALSLFVQIPAVERAVEKNTQKLNICTSC